MRHITDAEYKAIVRAIVEAKYPSRREVGRHQQIVLEDPIVDVSISVNLYEDGKWEVGTTDESGCREWLWTITKSHFEVNFFESFNRMGDNIPCDFDAAKLEKMLHEK